MPDIESAFLHILAASYGPGEVMTDDQARDAEAADDAATLARWHEQGVAERDSARRRYPQLHTNPWDAPPGGYVNRP
jgi:hypothetical protein